MQQLNIHLYNNIWYILEMKINHYTKCGENWGGENHKPTCDS